MEEIGLQFEIGQEKLLDAVRRYVSQGGMRLIEECPLRQGMKLLSSRLTMNVGASLSNTDTPAPKSRGWHTSPLNAIFQSYFDYYFRGKRRRALIVGPRVGRWTGILYPEKAIDCRLLDWVSKETSCRAVGFCFIEKEEYSYIEIASGRIVEIFSSFLTDGGGKNFWSARGSDPPPEGKWIAEGFLKNRYQFIPGFYDLPFLRGAKKRYSCYHYSAFPDLYDEKGNYPLSAFRYFYFHCAPE